MDAAIPKKLNITKLIFPKNLLTDYLLISTILKSKSFID